MDRINGAGHVGHMFVAEDVAINRPPTEITVDWLNTMQEELAALPEGVGMTLDPNNRTQVREAIQRMIDAQSGNYALDTGAVNAYVVALSPAITAYGDGMTVRVKAVNANNGASTLNAGGGVVSLVNDVGGALADGDIPAGGIFTATYIANKFYMTSLVQSQADRLYAKFTGSEFSTGGGDASAYTVTTTPSTSSYVDGQRFRVKFTVANIDAPTINFNGLGNIPLMRGNNDGSLSALVAHANLNPCLAAGHLSEVEIVESGTQARVITLPPRTYSGIITRDLTAAAGSVSETGVGFVPREIEFTSCIVGTLVQSFGTAGGGGNDTGQCMYRAYNSANDGYSADRCAYAYTSAANYNVTTLQSMDADGFTLMHAKNGAPAGTLVIMYKAKE